MNKSLMTENERILISRFRTGSHSLAVEIGRFSNTPRINRLCVCHLGVQTIWHIFMECPITKASIYRRYNDLEDIFNDEKVSKLLFVITNLLKIAI